MAKQTRFLRDQVIIEELKEPGDENTNCILGFYNTFKKYLIYDLTEEEFADLYSQTVTYGLFITDIFPVKSVGIVTARDKLTIHWTPEEVMRTISSFTSMDPEKARAIFNLGPDAKDWKVEFAQKDLLESGLKRENIVPILYRPFDTRYTYYTGSSTGFHCRPRDKVMKNMLKKI